MTSRLLLPAALRRYADDQAEVDIPSGTLGVALDDLSPGFPSWSAGCATSRATYDLISSCSSTA